MIPKK